MTTLSERFDYDTHAPLLAAWQRARGLPGDVGPRELYPRTGLVVDGCAAGFLYRTDARGVAYLDGFIADPAVDADRRARALDILVAELVRAADEGGVVALWAQTPHRSLVEVGERHGFRKWSTGACIVRVRKE